MTTILQPERRQTRHDVIAAVLDDEGIEHFGAGELYRHHNDAWPYEIDYPPPTGLAENIRETIVLADEIRDRWGSPVTVLSGWRSPVYNDLLGSADNEHRGAEDSQHLYFHALDLQPTDGRYIAFAKHCERIVGEWRDEGRVVGLGLYSTFVHVDTGRYGYSRDWDLR